ncbi:hypothetical protein NKI79_05415 [Mesorhizobium sp. M0340]|uniref:hypothetical protein n=1 Tax=Mesorhizobium sp. M0340 TaxID=2956939 RepID=UPI0033364D82
MGIQVKDIQILCKEVGGMYVLTSPAVPELHVANVDKQAAYDSIQATLDMIERMKERQAARNAHKEMQAERRYA